MSIPDPLVFWIRALCVVWPLLLVPKQLLAPTFRVPTQWTTIQAAIHQASDGDTVLVEAGSYRERLQIVAKEIVVRGESGAAQTLLNGEVAPGNVVTIAQVGRSMALEDLSITGGRFNPAIPESVGAAIFLNQASPTIRRCRLVGNQARIGGGVTADFFSRPRIESCWIAENEGGGIFIEKDTGMQNTPASEIVGTFVVRNVGFGISIVKGAHARIESCTVAFNTGDGVRGEIGEPVISVLNSIITDNQGAGIVRYDNSVCFALRCNDVFANLNGNWVGTNPGDACFAGPGTGSLSIDPLYRDAAGDDLRLDAQSPLFALCAPASCGALGAGNVCRTSVESFSWSAIKLRYRGPEASRRAR